MADGLFAALLAFQAEAPTLSKDATNPHYRSRYTPLDTIVETIGPLLAKHELVWIAKPGQDDTGQPVLNYTLAHAPTGEREDGSMPLLLSKNDPQGQGSGLTYARRYSICAVLNLVADEDDDGNSASEPQARPKPQIKDADAPATDGQRKFIGTLLKRAKITRKDDANRVLSVFTNREITGGTAELTKGEAGEILDRLQNGEVPSVAFPSDVPEPAEGEFVHEPSVGDPVPFDAVAAVTETFGATEEPS